MGLCGWEIYHDLGEFCHDVCELIERSFGGGDDFGEHEGSEDAIAGRLAWQDDVAGLFPAETDVLLAHSGGNIGIANGSDFGLYICGGCPVEEALISHNGDGDFVKI